MTNTEMISEFQCSGCVCGGPTTSDCDKFEMQNEYGIRCVNHVCGTRIFPGGINFALGLPNGFNRGGIVFGRDGQEEYVNKHLIRIWPDQQHPEWNKFNVPVWAMEKDGFLFVRTYMPRINRGCTDVIENGKMKGLCPDAIDVGEFYEEID